VKIPEPKPGLIVRYSYLWRADELKGNVEGDKDRPCAIIISSKTTGSVSLIPITHSAPEKGEEHLSIEIPLEVCRQCGLDDEGNYVRLGEVNQFTWPGYDLRPLPRDPSRCEYGMLPEDFFGYVMKHVIEAVSSNMVSKTKRD
jgi:hypothetical protein